MSAIDDMANHYENRIILQATDAGFTPDVIRTTLCRMKVEPTDLRVKETTLMIGRMLEAKTELIEMAYDAVKRNYERYGGDI